MGVTQKQMDEKLDGIVKMLAQLNTSSEMGSAEKPHQPTHTSPIPPPNH
jgi:hypothetical protein